MENFGWVFKEGNDITKNGQGQGGNEKRTFHMQWREGILRLVINQKDQKIC